jgi:hypothetical protein
MGKLDSKKERFMNESSVIRKRVSALAATALCVLVAGAMSLSGQPATIGDEDDHETEFNLHPFPPFLNCISNPNDDDPPEARVEVHRGRLNDTLTLELEHFKPGLAFDLFTVERSKLLANGTVDPATTFTFGLALYQSAVQVNERGRAKVSIRTILLDRIFGFDDEAGSKLIHNTFHAGFWFDNPADAVTCGFPAAAFTPFNGEHHAGPLAMISVPDPVTNLGPLCINPDTSKTPATCHP